MNAIILAVLVMLILAMLRVMWSCPCSSALSRAG